MPDAITPPVADDADLQAPYFVPGGQAIVGPQTYDVPRVRTAAIRDALDRQAAERAWQFDAMQNRAREAVNEQIQMREWMDQNRMANDQLKNIASARRFMATRRLGNDIEDAVAQGVPREVAVANGIMRNLDALGGNLSPLVSASHAAGVAMRPGVEPSIYTEPGGQRFVRMGNQLHPVQSDEMKKSQRVTALNNQIKELDSQLKELNTLPGEDAGPAVEDIKAQRKALMGEVADLLGVKEKLAAATPDRTGTPVPLPKTKAEMKEGVVYQAKQGLVELKGGKIYAVK